MSLPPLAEDVLKLTERPDLKPTHRTLLKLAAALITQTEMSFNDFLSLKEPRIEMAFEEYDTLPDRFELWDGKVVPKEWNCPERVGEGDKE